MKNTIIKKTDMKRNIILFVTVAVLAGLFGLLSCSKDKGPGVTEHFSFTAPDVPGPANGELINLGAGVLTGNVNLQWVSTNESGDAVKADLYFGTSASPALYGENETALSVSVPVNAGNTYHWRVVMKDKNGVTTDGPTWNFDVYHPMTIYTGSYTADEPAEAYTYPIDFSRKTDYILETENYWNSGWHAEFTLDYAAKTYTMALTTWGSYSAVESGTIDPATGTMTGTYSIYHPAGTEIETGVHTYTKN
jgi:hypothetical protein